MTNKKVDEAFKAIDDFFDKIQRENKKDLDNAAIKPIHDRFPLTQNGITALIAPPGNTIVPNARKKENHINN